MEVMPARLANLRTIESCEEKYKKFIEDVAIIIAGRAKEGQFKVSFRVDSVEYQNRLFDYLTGLGYTVNFFMRDERLRKLYPETCRIVEVSWENIKDV